MTKHWDVNKCRRKEKCKMPALIRQANSGYEMASKPEIKEGMYGRRDGKKKTQTF